MDDVPLEVRVHRLEEEGVVSDRPVLVLIHGYLGASNNWTLLLKHFVGKYHVVFFDMGGFGLNSRP